MSFNNWKNSVVGHHIDVDGVYGAQCVDVAESFCKYFWPTQNWPTELGYGNAKDLYKNSNPIYFQKIPYRAGIKAKQGDLIVYGATPTNAYGHIAVVISANTSTVTVVEQNGFNPTGAAYIATRGYTNCTGFLRPINVNLGGIMSIITKVHKPSRAEIKKAWNDLYGTDPSEHNYETYSKKDISWLWHDFAYALKIRLDDTRNGKVTKQNVLDYVNKNLS